MPGTLKIDWTEIETNGLGENFYPKGHTKKEKRKKSRRSTSIYLSYRSSIHYNVFRLRLNIRIRNFRQYFFPCLIMLLISKIYIYTRLWYSILCNNFKIIIEVIEQGKKLIDIL